MMVVIMGEIGRSMVDRTIRMAIVVLVGLLMCHRFMWFVVCGGSVIVAQYARRR